MIYFTTGLLIGFILCFIIMKYGKHPMEGFGKELEKAHSEAESMTKKMVELYKNNAELEASNRFLKERLDTQKTEIMEMKKQLNLEFENIASRILEEKTDKFTRTNAENLGRILNPLGENIEMFRKRVEEVYDKESKERFSLGKEVERLVLLNRKISEEANNLTKALKGDSKVQGDWGQMILENILEKSGLEKGREYLVQEYLKDDGGKYLTNHLGQRMQPDVIVSYPDNRKVIIDSKVSLTAYARYTSAEDEKLRSKSLSEHLQSLRKHVDELSAKNYQDYACSLDFVMMFVPNEAAYMLAMHGDPDLWQYAYDKRILLISPTNLIASLRLISNLWKREYQNRNAMEIADRGAILYDKFVSFVVNFTGVGESLDKAKFAYDNALGKLKSGKGNLISQAEKLRKLGLKTKKKLPSDLSDNEEID